MSLPADVARCRGWFEHRTPEEDCLSCERRLNGIADYLAGRVVVWFAEPPKQTPCPEKLEPKK